MPFITASRERIRVGYISKFDGYISGLSIDDANAYEKLSPGTTFIFVNGDGEYRFGHCPGFLLNQFVSFFRLIWKLSLLKTSVRLPLRPAAAALATCTVAFFGKGAEVEAKLVEFPGSLRSLGAVLFL